jgi:acetyltransferase
MVWFHEALSDMTVYLRYFHPMKLSSRVSHQRLIRICDIDYETEMVLVAECETPTPREREIIGVARMNVLPNTDRAETAVVISDGYHGRGLGTELLRRVIEIGRDKGVRFLVADMLPENDTIKHVYAKLGFKNKFDREEGVVRSELDLWS